MPSAFLDPNAKVAVKDGEDVIYVRAKMTRRLRGEVQQELLSLQIRQDVSGRSNGSGRSDENEMIVDAKISALLQEAALLRANIVGWSGPSFEGVPCTASTIDLLDPELPIVRAVLTEIDRLNTAATKTPAAALPPSSGGKGGDNSGPLPGGKAES